jgi:transcriptional regulator with XRE-family HTH domain
MVQPKELDGAANPRAFFGAEVRRMRVDAGLTQEELGARMFLSGAYIGQIEATTRAPNKRLAERFDAALEANGHFARVYELVERQSEHRSVFATYAELESRATKIEEYAACLVPGLLQTPAYARELFRAVWLYTPEEKIEEMVELRMKRARILDDPAGVQLWEILDESVIRRPDLEPELMREQLEHIAALIRARRIVVQVLPFSAGMHALMDGPLTMMTFADAPKIAYTEGPHSDHIMDDPEAVKACELSYDLARATALSPAASLALIESAIKDYTHGH